MNKTNNKIFDDKGYLYLKSFYDISDMIIPYPKERGLKKYWGKKIDQYNYKDIDPQVNGCLSTYNRPKYRELHSLIKLRLEKIIGKKLYKTYYYDRFYFPGQKLDLHMDRDACEISLSMNISTNLKVPWEFKINSFNGSSDSFNLKPGDAILYRGCECPHWRDSMPGKMIFWNKKLYYHQVFFHYVLSDGDKSHNAFDPFSTL